MTKYDQLKEVNEAINAGRRALYVMEDVSESLNDARGLGVWDIFGGGIFVSAMKHSRLEDAEMKMQNAVTELRRFRTELNDVDIHIDCNMDISSVLKGFDLFFDNIFADMAVQSKIKKMQCKVDETIEQIKRALETLHILQRNLEKGSQV